MVGASCLMAAILLAAFFWSQRKETPGSGRQLNSQAATIISASGTEMRVTFSRLVMTGTSRGMQSFERAVSYSSSTEINKAKDYGTIEKATDVSLLRGGTLAVFYSYQDFLSDGTIPLARIDIVGR